MRILHTSDWHIGRSFHGTGMLETQREALTRLADVVREQRVDAVLVAGDVYDRALPAADAVAVLDEALAALREAGAVVVLTSGNHDSAVRLGFGARLMAASGVHLRTAPETLADPVELRDAAGGRVLVYGVPYLEPRHLGPVWGVAAHHTAVTAEAMRRVREDAAGRRAEEPAAVVVMAHLFAAGGHGSDSERDIGALDGAGGHSGPVGTLGQVPVSVFDGVDYAALGHLHGRQTMAPHVRYSGSPVAYSFSEAAHRKGAWLVDVADGAVQAVTPVDWQVGRGLAVLAGPLEELLSSPVHAAAEDCWVQATVTDDTRPPRAFARLKERFGHLLVYRWEPAGGRQAAVETRPRAGRGTVSDLEVAEGFVERVRSRPVDEAERALLHAAVEAARERSADEEARA